LLGDRDQHHKEPFSTNEDGLGGYLVDSMQHKTDSLILLIEEFQIVSDFLAFILVTDISIGIATIVKPSSNLPAPTFHLPKEHNVNLFLLPQQRLHMYD
jgi:hypothetical protein